MKKKLRDDRLRELAGKFGKLTPNIVIKDAKNPKSPLHGEFQWNITKAAQLQWLDTARRLIADVELRTTTIKHTYNSVGFVRDPRALPSEQGYIAVEVLQRDKEWAREAIDLEIKQVLSRLERLRALAVPLGQEARVEAWIAQLTNFMQQVAA